MAICRICEAVVGERGKQTLCADLIKFVVSQDIETAKRKGSQNSFVHDHRFRVKKKVDVTGFEEIKMAASGILLFWNMHGIYSMKIWPT